MAISKIRLTNTTTTAGQTSIDVKFDERRQLHRTLVSGAYLDIEDVCTLDEINRVSDQLPTNISVTVIEGDDIADLPTEEDIRTRTGFPILDFVTDETLSISGIPATHNVTGRNLLAGQTRASLTHGTGTSSLLFEACRPGAFGNLIRIIVIVGAGEDVDANVTPAGESESAIVITVTTNSGVSTANSIATAVNADVEAKLLVRCTGGGTGTAIVALASTALASGLGDGFKVYIGGIEQDVLGKVTDVLLPLRTRDFTGMVNGDGANCYVLSDSTVSHPLNIRIVT